MIPFSLSQFSNIYYFCLFNNSHLDGYDEIVLYALNFLSKLMIGYLFHTPADYLYVFFYLGPLPLKKKLSYLFPYYWVSFLSILNIDPLLYLYFVQFPLIQKTIFLTKNYSFCCGRACSFDIMPFVYFCFC